MRTKTLLALSQVYFPDPASSGQHLGTLAESLAERGHRVRVITAREGYDDPGRTYSETETIRGVDVVRISIGRWGKETLRRRAVGGVLFTLRSIIRGAFAKGKIAGVLLTTGTPTNLFSGWILSYVRRAPLIIWAMDINPDQAVAAGAAKPDSFTVRILGALVRLVLRRAAAVITLDEVMASRLAAKGADPARTSIIPPWPHNTASSSPREPNVFREQWGLTNEFVFMYSGNHSPVHPLEPLLNAIAILDDLDAVVLFVGGGQAKRQLDEAVSRMGLGNVRSFPYQPFDRLDELLAVADCHLIVMGDAMYGIVHPSKLYGALAASRPVLVLGPHPSCREIESWRAGWCVANESAAAIAKRLAEIRHLDRQELLETGNRARTLSDARYAPDLLIGEMIRIIEQVAR